MPSTRLKIAGMEFNTIGEAVVEHDAALTVLRFAKPESGVYRRLNIKDGKITGAILLGENQNLQPIKQLIARARDVSAYVEEMTSATFDFNSLVRSGS